MKFLHLRELVFDWISVAYHELTAQKMKFSTKNFFSKCDQIRSFLQIWSHLLKKPLMKNFTFCAVADLRQIL